jgi:hypothetical protein
MHGCQLCGLFGGRVIDFGRVFFGTVLAKGIALFLGNPMPYKRLWHGNIANLSTILYRIIGLWPYVQNLCYAIPMPRGLIKSIKQSPHVISITWEEVL